MVIIDVITSALASNPILAGGIGTLVAGSALYVLRAIPLSIYQAINRALWTEVSVESYSNEYRDVDGFIEARRIPFFSRSLEIKDGSIKTGFGSGWGTYDGKLFKYSKNKSQQQISYMETIQISFLTRDRSIADRFMRDSKPDDHKNSIEITIFDMQGHAGCIRRRKRGLNTVFVDRAVKDKLVERFKWFLGSEEWHTSRGIPWKLGILLHGQPGTGKTSLIHALASDFGFNIKYIKSLHGLGQAFFSGGKDDLFVIEDIDTISGALNRGPTGPTAAAPANGPATDQTAMGPDSRLIGASPLHEILNAMDGMQTPDGLKFIVTTNHLKRLDPALVRPGRIDDVIEVGPLSLESAREMFKAFYGRDGILSYSPRTGAELQQMFSTMTAEDAEAELPRFKIAAVPQALEKMAG